MILSCVPVVRTRASCPYLPATEQSSKLKVGVRRLDSDSAILTLNSIPIHILSLPRICVWDAVPSSTRGDKLGLGAPVRSTFRFGFFPGARLVNPKYLTLSIMLLTSNAQLDELSSAIPRSGLLWPNILFSVRVATVPRGVLIILRPAGFRMT